MTDDAGRQVRRTQGVRRGVATQPSEVGGPRRQPRWWREVLLIGAWYGGYEGVRAVSPTQVGAAHRHAERLLGVERWAHLDPERALNRLVSGSSHLGMLAGGYYATLHFAVTVVALVWLYRRHRALYQHARTVLVTASAVSLLVFWFYPVAPPRLAMGGLDDIVVRHNVFGAGHAASTGSFVDLYAALPSLHVGWAFWVAAAIVRACPTSRFRHVAWLYPVTTALVVLATANHYLIDAAAGVVVIALAELASFGLARRRASVDRSAARTRSARSIDRERHVTTAGGLAPALIVVPTFDPAADHGRSYAEPLRQVGTPAA
jgi:hypothetical protein